MSNSSVIDKSTPVDLEGCPSRSGHIHGQLCRMMQLLSLYLLSWRSCRLGIGATVPKKSSFSLSNDPVERKLLAKLQSHNRNIIKKAKYGDIDEDSEEEKSESKAKAFAKKRPPSVNSFIHAKKKVK